MAGSTRIVERLRLRADSEAAVRRTAIALQDAFRTATLPDAGARVICVRSLHLGSFPAEASPQALSLLVESRFSAAGWTMQHGGDEDAHDARAVWFADTLEAHQLAALRLASGGALTQWFWPLALPDIAWPDAPGGQLRAIAFAVAAMDEAPSALPSWLVTLIRAGHRERLLAHLHPGDGRALAKSARIDEFERWIEAVARRAGESERSAPAAFGRRSEHSRARMTHTDSESPHSGDSIPARGSPPDDRGALFEFVMRREIAAESILRTRVSGTSATYPGRSSGADRGDRLPGTAPSALSSPGAGGSGTTVSRPADVSETDGRPTSRLTTSASPTAIGARSELGPESNKEANRSPFVLPYGERTAAGGLLFLLPVLERLGFPAWCKSATTRPEILARRIFHLLLSRLEIPEDDPAWAFAMAPDPVDGDPVDAAVRRKMLPQHLWLTRCRQLLRRRVHIGLASLVCRPARLVTTRTHVDVFLGLDAADVHVRRAGLDIDPGWVPWLGQVVAFHYEGR
jgi:hypothetical protein